MQTVQTVQTSLRPSQHPPYAEPSLLRRWLLRSLGLALGWLHRRRGVIAMALVSLLLAASLGLVVAVQPTLAILLLIVVVSLAALVWLARHLAPGAPWWMKAVFFVVVGQSVFNYGFSNILFFVGGMPVPLTECVLAVALLACANRVWFARVEVRLPVLLWLLFAWVVFNVAWHLPSGMSQYGVGAARDALPTVEMLFVIPGFVIAAICLQEGEQGQRWIRSVLVILALLIGFYGPLYPFSSSITAISPSIASVQQTVSIFGYFTTWPAMGVLSVVGLGLWRWQSMVAAGFWGTLAGLLIVFAGLLTFFIVQARIAYLFVALGIFVLLLIGGQGKLAARVIAAILLGLSVLLVIELSGLELNGRVGKLTVSGIYQHLETLTGAGSASNHEFSGAAGGVNQRAQWRQYSLRLWSASPATQALGIGFGPILTDLTTGGTAGEILVVREPHNSYVTTLTRSGLAGLGVMLLLHASVLVMSFRGYRRSYKLQRAPAAYFLGALFFELYALLNAWGEPHFEVAHFAVPSYFIYGTVFALYLHMFGQPYRHPQLMPYLQRAQFAPAQ